MKEFPVDKYLFFISPNKVVAISTFAKKRVRAVAKCAPTDVFDENKGKELAAARCDLKIAKKRLSRAQYQLAQAHKELQETQARVEQMMLYKKESEEAYAASIDKLNQIEYSMKH